MTKYAIKTTDPQIKPYEFRGLKGRYGHWPALSKHARRTFLIVYGQHATLERVQSVATALQAYGDVYMVDTPGFGGMDPSYKLGEDPSLDFMASHLAHFVEKHIPADRYLSVVGISYGFQIVTTMLANYPEITKRVEHAVSFVGFVSHRNLDLPTSMRIFMLELGARPARTRVGSKVFALMLRPGLFKVIFFFNRPFNTTLKDFDKKEAKRYIDDQIQLWMVNDHRTHGYTAWDFFKTADLTHLRPAVDVIHVGVPNDHLINNKVVMDELEGVYRNMYPFDLNLKNHAPLDIDSPEKVRELLPEALVTLIKSSRNETAVLK